MRGAPDLDRDYRHPRMKGDKARREVPRAHRSQPSGSSIGAGDSSNGRPSPAGPGRCAQMTPVSSLPADAWDLLPPLELIIDAVHMFTRQYFQLGFIPQRSFLEQLRLQPRSVSVFLLLSILSVSARLTPRLVEKHGDAVATAELYMEHASAIALTELYQEPTLARCQAFYLLSLAEQGSGYRNRSSVNMSIALRMAILMQLHREETYKLENATPHMVQKAESARRTLVCCSCCSCILFCITHYLATNTDASSSGCFIVRRSFQRPLAKQGLDRQQAANPPRSGQPPRRPVRPRVSRRRRHHHPPTHQRRRLP